ncbi:cysteine hydrolase [Mesorhizobium sp. B2-3-4]|nr:cysteine hydrolase [Mesorhizobium sp. B2-3-4]
MAARGLVHGPLGKSAVHICVDMQGLFGTAGPWPVPWAKEVLPAIEELAGANADRTIFTRFIPAERPGKGMGMWAQYYRRWAEATIENIDPELIELMPDLKRFVPPAKILDKKVYSPWTEGRLDDLLNGMQVDTLVITGGETDVCVLATVLGAVDRGYRVVVVSDAVCSSADQTHDASMELYRSRFSEQLETVVVKEVLENWRPSQRDARAIFSRP